MKIPNKSKIPFCVSISQLDSSFKLWVIHRLYILVNVTCSVKRESISKICESTSAFDPHPNSPVT